MEGSSRFHDLRCVITVHMKASISLVYHESSLLHDGLHYGRVMSHLRT